MYLDIAFSLNRALWLPLLTAMNSILQNTADPAALRFNIVIPPGDEPFFTGKIAAAFGDSAATFRVQEYRPPAYLCDYLDAKFKETKTERRVSRYMQYSRLFLKDIFPDLTKVAYFDGDVIVLGDVNQLFAEIPTFTAENYIGAVPQFFPSFMYFSNPFKALDEIRKFKKTFNSGVLLTDVTFWTEETYERLKYYLNLDRQHNYGLFNLGDETVMNLMFKRDYIPLDKSWNRCGYGNLGIVTFFLSKDVSQMNVIHWSGGHHKPWRSPNIPFADLWRKYRPAGMSAEV